MEEWSVSLPVAEAEFSPSAWSFTSIKNSYLCTHYKTLYWRLSCNLKLWQLSFCYQGKYLRTDRIRTSKITERLFYVKLPLQKPRKSNINIISVVVFSSWALYVMINVYEFWPSLTLLHMFSPSLTTASSLWAPLLPSKSTVLQGHRQENRFCLCMSECVCVSVCVSVCACPQRECRSKTRAVDRERLQCLWRT